MFVKDDECVYIYTNENELHIHLREIQCHV